MSQTGMSQTDKELLASLSELKARAAIGDVLVRYCHALDRGDEAMLRSCFHDGSLHDHGEFVGSSTDFCTFAIDVLKNCVATHHHLGNIWISVAGVSAEVQSYYVAYHRVPEQGEMPFPRALPNEDLFIAGRYIDRFECRNGEWRIVQRRGTIDW